ncbi:porin [Paraburkholderia sp. Ac-20340]|uniref:porin n=1 Tax=Paraburkholderia sp. Ac-20340 TaxID=2703888 RepID=UPI00197D65BF|nr:porin [Paraburkholderia sp. Ac-20340]MBN3853448.1 porin [Paraburkholderia sp. Ac-20340]
MKHESNFLSGTVKALVTAAATAALPAYAQSSITFYGVADDAITYVSNQKGHSNLYLRQGNLYASKFGLKGSEILGGDTKAIFVLESGFDLNNGDAASSGSIFNRQAYVGLTNSQYGSATLGRQYTPWFLFLGPLSSVSFLTGAAGAHPGDIDGMDTTVRANSAAMYVSPEWRGLQAAGMVAFGGIAGNPGRGQTISLALRYSHGPLSLAAGYLQMDNAFTSSTSAAFDSSSSGSFNDSVVNQGYLTARSMRNAALAGNYDFGSVRLGLMYSNVRYLPGSRSLFADTATFDTYGTYARWQIEPAVDLAAGVSYTLASRSNGITNAARYTQISMKQGYRLSKRTGLYVLEAWQHASGQTLDSSGEIVNAAPAVGDSQNLTASSIHNQFVGMLGIDMAF